jgi:hypothetical protein
VGFVRAEYEQGLRLSVSADCASVTLAVDVLIEPSSVGEAYLYIYHNMFDPNLPNPRLPKPFRVEPLEPYALDESYIVHHPHKDLDRRRLPRSAKYSDRMSRDYFDYDPYDYEDEEFFCRGRHYGGYCDDDYRGRGSIIDKIRRYAESSPGGRAAR